MRFYKLAILTVAIPFIMGSFGAFADDIPYGQTISVPLENGETWAWRVDVFDVLKTLKVHTTKESDPYLVADISDCFFCSGEGDNCQSDGIQIIEMPRPKSPIISVVCHVGAHSQRLMIFDPQQDRAAPVYQRTGAYWLNTSPGERDLTITYDKPGFAKNCPDGNPSFEGLCDIQETWPPMAKKR